MELTKDDVRNLAKAINLDIPEGDLNTVALRLSSLLEFERRHDPQPGHAGPRPGAQRNPEFV